MDIRVSVFLCCLVFPYLSIHGSPPSINGVGLEVIALMEIKSYLVDPNEVLRNWDGESPDPSSWNMITCSPNGQVITLEAPSQGLSGVLGPSIGNLTNIQAVFLRNNNISGNIPSEIGKLSQLRSLDLANNSLCGQIPSTFSHLKNLHFLWLNGNNLSGEIPAYLANFTQLHLLDLSFNNLSGEVPILPAQIFNIEGNPYLCNNGADKVGCTDKADKGSLPSTSKAKQNYPPRIFVSGIFYPIPVLFIFLKLFVSYIRISYVFEMND